ncbi:hypothetical protein GF376_00275 [Candidatus Peregrinibacteria bacterium]|nr:hypothetical protein [Candidatus Peregrinibacteria bacterium]
MSVRNLILPGLVVTSILFLAACNVDGTTETASNISNPVENTSENHSDSVIPVAAAAVYEDYSESRFDELEGNKPFAIFFHAGWCPTCRALDTELKNELSELPEDAIILKANYDGENELKQKYGINMQSFVVIVNKNGEVSFKQPDPALDTIKSEFAKVL